MDAVAGRALWMDRLRGLAVVLVIAWHVVSIPTFFGVEMPDLVRWLNDALSPYRIPTLLVLSGMLLRQSLDKPAVRYYWGKFANIVWPFLVWCVIYLLANPSVDGSSPAYWLGESYLWYLVVIAFCYAIGPLIRWVHPLLLSVVFIALALLFSSAPSSITQELVHAPYFFIGVAAVPYVPRLLKMPGWIVLGGAVIALAWAAYSASHLGYAPRLHPVGTPISLAGIGCLMWLASKPRRMPALEWAGRHSLELYVAHFPLIVLACAYCPTGVSRPVLYLLLAAVGLGGAAILARFFSKTPLFRLPVPRHARDRPGQLKTLG